MRTLIDLITKRTNREPAPSGNLFEPTMPVYQMEVMAEREGDRAT